MDDTQDNPFGFAAAEDVPIPYLQRIRDYYQALGYGEPYRWAHYAEVPFTALARPFGEIRVGLVTTAARYQPDKGDQGPGAPYNAAAKFYEVWSGPSDEDPDLGISHIAIDRAHTTAEDQGTWFPLAALRTLAREGVFAGLGPRFHGLPTNRSHRTTLEVDVPELVARCSEDGIDGAILVPNCPVCHQSASLAARGLEEAGIATVVMGAAKDIVEHVGVPRLLFSDFPLGNSAGRPHDPGSQLMTARLALDLIAGAPGPRTTMQSPLRWADDPAWKADYSNAARLSAEEIAARRREFDRGKAEAARLRAAVR